MIMANTTSKTWNPPSSGQHPPGKKIGGQHSGGELHRVNNDSGNGKQQPGKR
jgi:hypothetical protein